LLTIPLLKAMFVVVFFLTKEDEILTVWICNHFFAKKN
jgi:hypothetical protein